MYGYAASAFVSTAPEDDRVPNTCRHLHNACSVHEHSATASAVTHAARAAAIANVTPAPATYAAPCPVVCASSTCCHPRDSRSSDQTRDARTGCRASVTYETQAPVIGNPAPAPAVSSETTAPVPAHVATVGPVSSETTAPVPARVTKAPAVSSETSAFGGRACAHGTCCLVRSNGSSGRHSS